MKGEIRLTVTFSQRFIGRDNRAFESTYSVSSATFIKILSVNTNSARP